MSVIESESGSRSGKATARAHANIALDQLADDQVGLGELMEQSCLAMHASALAARPGVIYLRGVTLDGFLLVRELRRGGLSCWFTADAGPHVKALCARADAAQVAAALAALPGVTRTSSGRWRTTPSTAAIFSMAWPSIEPSPSAPRNGTASALVAATSTASSGPCGG